MEQQRDAINRLEKGLGSYIELVVKDMDDLPKANRTHLENLPRVLDKTTHLMQQLTAQGIDNPSRVIGGVVEDIAQLF